MLLGLRPLVLWAWLMGNLVTGQDPDPVAAWLTLALVLFAAARWSATVRREATAALLLLDAPAIFTIHGQQAWPMALGALLFAAVLLAGLFTLRGLVLIGLVLELVLLAKAGDDLVKVAATGAVLLALTASALWPRAGPVTSRED